MPRGKTHEKIIILLIPYMIFILYVVSSFFSVNRIPFVLLGAGIFYFGGIYFSPDLDTKSNVYYKWKILRYIWNPYIYVFKHRSLYTHGILIGTTIRIIYICIPIGVFVSGICFLILHLSIDQYINYIISIITNYSTYWIEILVVLELSSLAHTIPDVISTIMKKHRKTVYSIIYFLSLSSFVVILLYFHYFHLL